MGKNYHLIKVAILAGFFCISCGIFTPGQAQQDPMYSQYMFNGLAFNPAYAGSRDALTLAGLYRRMWLGIPGAPVSQTFALHLPNKSRRQAFGFSMVNDQASYISQTLISLDYAYRIPIGPGKLALGLRATGYNFRVDWTRADLKNPNDIVPSLYPRSLFFPNAGFGIYYHTQNWYVGASVPRILINSLDPDKPGVSFSGSDTTDAIFNRHYFINGGVVFNLSSSVQMKPSVLVKVVERAPLQADLNLNFYFNKKFGVGTSYRSGDGMVFMLEYMITPQLWAGYAYDYPLTRLNGYTSGSHELMLTYDFIFGVDGVVSPRLF
ncbi:MAG: type IX secretion system membrane protein PorP/SprF [Bacteroidia bacterium]|nr:type IX secretion system membrane protein PorP/SprF [Bacteroidia bacterium]